MQDKGRLKRVILLLSVWCFGFAGVAGFSFLLLNCSSRMEVKKQDYASLKTEWTFETDFAPLWKAVESSLGNHRIVEVKPKSVNAQEWNQIKERRLMTDWVYGRSGTRYVEYKVNGFPKKTYLQTRYRYRVNAEKVLGGIHVSVDLEEELENLNQDGSSAGYRRADEADSSRAHDLLEKIKTAVLAA